MMVLIDPERTPVVATSEAWSPGENVGMSTAKLQGHAEIVLGHQLVQSIGWELSPEPVTWQ